MRASSIDFLRASLVLSCTLLKRDKNVRNQTSARLLSDFRQTTARLSPDRYQTFARLLPDWCQTFFTRVTKKGQKSTLVP